MATRSENYAAKLRDPRWQRRRLDILSRDNWHCVRCADDKSTLHVHHRFYTRGEPWDAPDAALVTLCENCHGIETEEMSCAAHDLILTLKLAGFFSDAIRSLAEGFGALVGEEIYQGFTEALAERIADPAFREKLMNDYFGNAPSGKEGADGQTAGDAVVHGGLDERP